MNAFSRRLAAYLIVGVVCLTASSARLAPARCRRPRTEFRQPCGHSPSGLGRSPQLTYYGGQVLSHVKVDVVVWDQLVVRQDGAA